MLRIGQVARQFKVSLQLLRHYEGLGLLSPSKVDGQRAYDEADVRQLSLILEGRRCGLPLAEIGVALGRQTPPPPGWPPPG